jgi:hypothetical protein
MNLDQNIHYVPLFDYAQKVGASSIVPHINMKLYEKVQFYIKCEELATADFVVTVTQSAVTAGTTPTAIAGRYRIAAAGGTDSMGAVTTFESTGFSLEIADDHKTYIVDVMSSDLTTANKPYVGLAFTDPGTADAYVTIWAMCWPKYPKATNASALT